MWQTKVILFESLHQTHNEFQIFYFLLSKDQIDHYDLSWPPNMYGVKMRLWQTNKVLDFLSFAIQLQTSLTGEWWSPNRTLHIWWRTVWSCFLHNAIISKVPHTNLECKNCWNSVLFKFVCHAVKKHLQCVERRGCPPCPPLFCHQ